MRGFSRMLMNASLSALAIGALSAPAAGGVPEAYVAIVQGMPGKVVDVCFGNKEVRSGLRYGRKFTKVVKPDSYAIKFRAAQPGACTGALLVAKNVTLSPQEDLTIVATAKAPMRVVVFDNAGLGFLPSAAVASFAWRNAADVGGVGGVVFRYAPDTWDTESFTPPDTAADPVWVKGDQGTLVDGPLGTHYYTVVTMAGVAKPIAGPIATEVQVNRRHEWILVGTTKKNAKLVTIVRPAAFL